MGFFGKISTSISGAWTNMKSAKWFTGLQKVLTGVAAAGLTGYGYGAYKGIKDKVLNKKKKKKTPKK